MWQRKGWSDPTFDREMSAWMYLLLGAVDVSNDKAISYLKEFVVPTSSHHVCSVYQQKIVNQVGERERERERGRGREGDERAGDSYTMYGKNTFFILHVCIYRSLMLSRIITIS